MSSWSDMNDPDLQDAADRNWQRDKDRIEREENYKDHLAAELDRQRIRQAATKQLRAEEDQADPAAYDDQYLDADQLANLPTPDPMISGVLDRHSYMILRGRDHTYKTFIALDWALCLATGKPWQGKTVHPTRVLYIAGEGAYGIKARKDAWELAWQFDVDPERFTLRQSAVNFYKGGPALEDLITRVSEGGYGLVIIDTLRRASGKADGNGTDMGVVVDNFERVKRATLNGSVLTLTHTDKGDNDSRGFSGIEDDADIVWHSKRDTDRGPLTLNLELVKMKNGPEGLTFNLTMATALNSLVVSKTADRLTLDELYATDQMILTAMRETFALTGATTTQLIEVTELPRSTVYKSRGRLLNSSQLISTRRGNSDVLTIPQTAQPLSTNPHPPEHESTANPESTPGIHTESTPNLPAVHTTPEHESTPVHTQSTPESTPVHASPPVLRQGRV